MELASRQTLKIIKFIWGKKEKKKLTCIVFIRLSLRMALHALHQVLEGLNLAWDCEPTTMIKSKLLFHLFQQHLEQRVGKIAGGNDEPPKLWPYINRQIPFGDIRWWFRAVATILIWIWDNIWVPQPHINCWWNAPGRLIGVDTIISFWAESDWLPLLKEFLQPNNLPDSGHLVTPIVLHCYMLSKIVMRIPGSNSELLIPSKYVSSDLLPLYASRKKIRIYKYERKESRDSITNKTIFRFMML